MKLFRGGVRSEQLTLATRHLATLLGSGILITEALTTLAETTPDPALGEVLRDVCVKLHQGQTLSRALTGHPDVFQPLYLSLVRVGESTGGLVMALEALAGWMQRDQELKRAVQAALVYPAFVLALTFALAWLFSANIIPRFADILADLHAPLPWPTRVVLTLSRAMAHPISWLLGLTLVLNGWGFLRSLRSRPEARMRIWLLGSYVPVVGRLVQLASLARYCSAASLLLGAGVNLLLTVKLSAEASDSPILHQDMERILREMRQGETLGHLMGKSSLYPMTLTQLVAAGEETSRLPELFQRLARLYEEEVYYQVELLKAVMEPLLLGLVSGMVGLLVLALLVPLYSVINQLG